jgi:acyl carrier protein
MDKIELSIQQIMADVFEKSEEQISIDSTQDEIDSWDSIKHLNLIVALEEEFGIELPIEEIGNLISFKLINIIVKELLQNKSK